MEATIILVILVALTLILSILAIEEKKKAIKYLIERVKMQEALIEELKASNANKQIIIDTLEKMQE